MNKTILLSLLLLSFAITTAAQSGRRVTNPPPPPREPVVETPTFEAPPARLNPIAGLSVLPDDILNRELKSVEEGSFRLADFRGKVVVVNLWATWCGPCRREVPDYEKVRKQFAGKPVEFIGLTTENPRTASEKVRQFAREFHFGFRLGWADPQMAQMLMNGKRVIPQTMVIAGDGRVISHWDGYSSGQSRDRLRDTIERALESASTQN